jgi:hypothetical protein
MSTDNEDAQRNEDKVRLKAFWEGSMDEPFIMDRINFHCDCDVFLPTAKTRLGFVVRSVLLWVSRMIPPSRLKVAVLRLTGMKIGESVYVSPGVVIDPLWPWLIELEDGVILGLGCRVLSHECTVKHFRIGRTRIGQKSVIGAGSSIRAGVTIGKRVTVGCNSYVNSDIPDDQTVGGVPAKPLAHTEQQ